MTIGMDSFAAKGAFETYDPFATDSQVTVFQLQCRSCGYEPDDVVSTPHTCPKCRAEAWERFARPGSILENSNRYDR